MRGDCICNRRSIDGPCVYSSKLLYYLSILLQLHARRSGIRNVSGDSSFREEYFTEPCNFQLPIHHSKGLDFGSDYLVNLQAPFTNPKRQTLKQPRKTHSKCVFLFFSARAIILQTGYLCASIHHTLSAKRNKIKGDDYESNL